MHEQIGDNKIQYQNMAKGISILNTSRRVVVSREAIKKQHAHTSSGLRDHCSELFTQMAALDF